MAQGSLRRTRAAAAAPRSPTRPLSGLVASAVDRWIPWRSGCNGSAWSDQRIVGGSSSSEVMVVDGPNIVNILKEDDGHTEDGEEEVGFIFSRPRARALELLLLLQCRRRGSGSAPARRCWWCRVPVVLGLGLPFRTQACGGLNSGRGSSDGRWQSLRSGNEGRLPRVWK